MVLGLAGCDPATPLSYEQCSDPPDHSSDVIESPDTAGLVQMLQTVIDDAGYAGAATVEHGLMVSNNAERFCAKTSVRMDWWAATDFECFEHLDDAAMQAAFEAYVATWPAMQETLVPLAAVEDAANGCFADIVDDYEPCGPVAGLHLQVTYSRDRWVTDCDLEQDVATVDLVTGELVACGTLVGGGGCDE